MNALRDGVKGWLNAGLGLLYPEVCQLCGAGAGDSGGGLCLRRLPSQGAIHPGAVLRAMRPAIRRGHHDPVRMRQLPGDGMALPVGALGGGGARPGAGGDSPLQIPAGSLVRAVPGRSCSFSAAEPVLAGQELGHDCAGPAASHKTARARIQPGRTPGQPAGRGDADSREQPAAAARRTHAHADAIEPARSAWPTSATPSPCGTASS